MECNHVGNNATNFSFCGPLLTSPRGGICKGYIVLYFAHIINFYCVCISPSLGRVGVGLFPNEFFWHFSLEAVYAYICKLEMQYRWAKLDPETGKETFKQIIDNLRGEAKVPEEFIRK